MPGDFTDNTASKGEVCHPSDNLAAVLAADHAGRAELRHAAGLLGGCRRRLHARARPAWATNALALAGVSSVSLAVIQAEPVSRWKGLAAGETAARALHNRSGG